MKNKTLIIIVAITALVCYIFLTVRSCNNELEASNWKARYDTLVTQFSVFENKSQIPVMEQRPAVFTDADALKAASAKAFNLKKKDERKIKKVDAFVQVEQVVEVIKDTIGLTPSPSPVGEGSWHSDSIVVPFTFKKDTTTYYLAGQMQKGYMVIDSMAIYNTIALRIAEKRNGWFAPRHTVVQVVNSNPIVKNIGIKSMVVRHKPNAWNKWIKPALFAGAGVAIGRAFK